jgi:hypothetical protein
MSVYPELERHAYAYTADDGNTYEIATTTDNGTVNGATAIPVGTHPPMPTGWVARYILGRSAGGLRTKCPIFDPDNDLWTSGATTFEKASFTFNSQGRIGEKRIYRGA